MKHSESAEPLEPLTPMDRIRVAGIAACDPRTVAAFCLDKPTQPSVRARIIAALRSLGWLERAKFGKAVG